MSLVLMGIPKGALYDFTRTVPREPPLATNAGGNVGCESRIRLGQTS